MKIIFYSLVQVCSLFNTLHLAAPISRSRRNLQLHLHIHLQNLTASQTQRDHLGKISCKIKSQLIATGRQTYEGVGAISFRKYDQSQPVKSPTKWSGFFIALSRPEKS